MSRDPRRQLLGQHELLRARLATISDLTGHVRSGERAHLDALRAEASDLLAQLREHLAIEERLVIEALSVESAQDVALRDRLARDHAEQRLVLENVVAHVEDPRRPPLLLARELADLVRCLLDDMELEERALLPRLAARGTRGSDSSGAA
jgi:iron-sulfur cluster repair protein YtfE (RIC family)